MISPEIEGITKFNLDFQLAPPPTADILSELSAWRNLCFELKLTGQDPNRYGGLAYGNVSQREQKDRFIISGTQTGGKQRLTAADFCLVTGFNLETNHIHARGEVKPSSEALTHAALYAANPKIRCILHVHSPEIWRNSETLGILTTPEDIGYGTPAMAKAVQNMAKRANQSVICMQGHPDGVVSYGNTVENAALSILRCLARALTL